MGDTIAAIATGGARCAVGIIRLSGPDAIAAAQAVFTPRRGGVLSALGAGRLVYGTLRAQGGAVLDQVLATCSRAPNSYTGEDTAELHCHGSPTVLALALEALFAQGVRQARAGEFTRRAVENGKLDLAQAEAVMDLIDAETPAAAMNAAGQLGGVLSVRVDELYSGLLDVMAHFHAVLDYPDEEIDPFRTETIEHALDTAARGVAELLMGYERGRYLTGGVPCAIVGRPNVGKSSLLNAILGVDRAIVTPHPGTTRDTVEERCRLGGVLLRLIDTAGLRESGDEIEQMGIARSRTALESAALALVVLDGGQALTGEDEAAMEAASAAPRAICVVNKSDLPRAVDMECLHARFEHVCVVSAATGEGLNALEAAVAALFPAGDDTLAGTLLTNARQHSAAQEAARAIAAARAALSAGFSPDAVLLDVESALAALGELTGKIIREDIIARIFERFCVGK